MASQKRRRKRPGYDEAPEEDIVDDLIIAAEYAQADPLRVPSKDAPPEENDEDENEIELKSEESEEADIEEKNIEDRDGEDSINSSSDEDSEVDLAEELARMQDEDAEGTNEHPKTAHEFDSYSTAVKQLESTFSMNLTVEEQDRLRLSASSVSLSSAGQIQHHMVQDRTIVVQSQPGLLLEEGNLLVLKTDKDLVPLGRIFEVFGPVSQPLYSIRLPEPPQSMVEVDKESTSIEDKKEQSLAEKIDAEVKEDPRADDPWAEDGRFANLLKTSPLLPVHYVKDGAKLIDTTDIYQISGRGCDASNVHDEEVVNPNEMYYSDDEEERQAKGKGRKSRPGRGRGPTRNRPGPKTYGQTLYAAPQGFYTTGPFTCQNSGPTIHQGYQSGPPVHPNQYPSAAYPAVPQQQQQQQQQRRKQPEEETDTVYYEY